MQIKNTKKTDMVIKSGFVNGKFIVDEETGEEINIIEVAKNLFGEGTFKITMTATATEEIDLALAESSEEE